ncbi:hypothetical protein JFU18_05230 [Bacillus sp. TH22]|uniref:hypothetical protein n=1 Tax=Bacillus TaxID=1386 RepID=UPI0019117115|nr:MULTISPECIES: hypothetical protein [unclassified Bacillus (in: firmicutes)]MBK5448053.1 hypothetical protein [Bacillus sp. TH22]MBK5453105.1 hypothetical protein [Bacillus sp. TH23]
MGLFSRERKVYFQQDCKERNAEIVKQKILSKASASECIITGEMLDEIISAESTVEMINDTLRSGSVKEGMEDSRYPKLLREISRVLSVSNASLFRMIFYFDVYEILVEVSNTTKAIIQFESVDEEVRDSTFSDIKVIGFIYRKKSTDQEIEKISEWMLEFKVLSDKIKEHNEALQKR